ncbi:MAG: hypothetical protein R3296_05465 [Oleiphilaceae bacterium]|nr:hypothetical protein [Oleiphilaceae bacterium]
MKQTRYWLTAALLCLSASLCWADDLGVTMSVMAEDEENLTDSITRQIELSEPVAQQSRSGRLELLRALRNRLTEQQRQELLAAGQDGNLADSEQIQGLIEGLDNGELKGLMEDLSGNSLVSLLEALDSNRVNQMVEELSQQEQQAILDELQEGSDEPALEDENDGPLLEDDPDLLDPDLPLVE